MLKVLSKDEKVYGRALLDVLFSNNEQAQGLVIATNSGRPSMDEDKIHFYLVSLQIGGISVLQYSVFVLTECMEKRYNLTGETRRKRFTHP